MSLFLFSFFSTTNLNQFNYLLYLLSIYRLSFHFSTEIASILYEKRLDCRRESTRFS